MPSTAAGNSAANEEPREASDDDVEEIQGITVMAACMSTCGANAGTTLLDMKSLRRQRRPRGWSVLPNVL